LGGVEIEAHDAGHVLGSVQYEIITREENLVYASHLNFNDTLISKSAEVAPCDTLILEATYPMASSSLPPRESVTAEIVKWALDCVHDHRIPTFATEPLGTAQELVRAFNEWTKLPVIVHPRIARINEVYRSNGVGLEYVDAGTENARALVEDGKCAVIIPRGFDVAQYGEFRTAYVTLWPTRAEKAAGNVFLLGEQADLEQLLLFVKEARPKVVLTFRGGSKVLAELVSKKLDIVGRILSSGMERSKPAPPSFDEKSIATCQDYILGLIQVDNLTYEKQELIARALSEGFKLQLIEEALNRLTKKNTLRYSQVTEGYSLP
jgi:putative mRNA 3-end processing factor